MAIDKFKERYEQIKLSKKAVNKTYCTRSGPQDDVQEEVVVPNIYRGESDAT